MFIITLIIISITIFILSAYTILSNRYKSSRMTEEKKHLSKTNQLPQPKQPNLKSEFSQAEDISIVYAIVSEQINQITQKMNQIYEKVSSTTQAQLIKEIDNLEDSLKQTKGTVENLQSKYKAQKTEFSNQITALLVLFEKIKQLLVIDNQSLVKQRDYLKKELRNQEIIYENLKQHYTTEVERLNRIIQEIKDNYPKNLLQKLQIEVANKNKFLEEVEKNTSNLKNNISEKIKFLDEILSKKSAEIDIWLNNMKVKNEEELFSLKDNVERLRTEVEQTNSELRKILNNIKKEQQEKENLLKQLNEEVVLLQSRREQIESLTTRKNFLETEISQLQQEYQQLQEEYKVVIEQKAQEIKNIEADLAKKVKSITKEWEEQEKFYTQELQRFKRRKAVLQNRKQKLLKIEQELKKKLDKEKLILEEKLIKVKAEFQTTKSKVDAEIRNNIGQMEEAENELKQKIETLRMEIKNKLQQYNDKIAELKKRSEIREQRIYKQISNSMKSNEDKLREMIRQTQEDHKHLKEKLKEIKLDKTISKTKISSSEEQIELYQITLRDISEKFNSTKVDVLSLEKEIEDIETNLNKRFNEIIKDISDKKRLLVEKLHNLLSIEDKLIIKSTHERKVKKEGL